MLQQKRLCGDGSYTTWAEELRVGDKQVNGEDDEFAHAANGTTMAIACKTARHRQIPSYCEFATHNYAMPFFDDLADINLALVRWLSSCMLERLHFSSTNPVPGRKTPRLVSPVRFLNQHHKCNMNLPHADCLRSKLDTSAALSALLSSR